MDLPVESVIDQVFNASLPDSENAARVRDALSLYGLPDGRDQDQALTYSIENGIARRRGTVIEQALNWAASGQGTCDASPVPAADDGTANSSAADSNTSPAAGAGDGTAQILATAMELVDAACAIRTQDGDLAEAERYLLRSIEIFGLYGDRGLVGLIAAKFELAMVYGNWGYALASSGRPDLAVDLYIRAKELSLENLRLRDQAGASHLSGPVQTHLVQVAVNMCHAAEALWPADRITASRLFRETLEMATATGNADFIQQTQDRLRPYGFLF